MKAATRSPEFRFYFFTSKYEETVAFYTEVLQLRVNRSWERPGRHRGTVFTSPSGTGLIEVEQGDTLPQIEGGFYIEVDDIDAWYDRVTAAGVTIKKSLGVTDYGHLNFKVVDPSGIEVGFSNTLHTLPRTSGRDCCNGCTGKPDMALEATARALARACGG